MEKALEILKKYQKNIASCREKCDEDEAILWDEINEAIAELEEAMKPKTCNGCIDEIISSNRCEFCIRTHPQDFYVAKDNT